MVNKKNQEYSEQILSKSKLKVRSVNHVGHNAWTDMEYSCRECNGKIKARYIEEKFIKIPNPEIFGENAKPVKDYRWINEEYFCKSCGATNKDLGKIAFETYTGGITG